MLLHRQKAAGKKRWLKVTVQKQKPSTSGAADRDHRAGCSSFNEEIKEWDFSKVVFTECQEEVTAKIETNLRTEPSTRSDDTVVAKLIHGETVVRTGIGSNGWSRVEYNGQTLYAVSSYLMIPEE